jgi:hypothetical protein
MVHMQVVKTRISLLTTGLYVSCKDKNIYTHNWVISVSCKDKNIFTHDLVM